MNQRLEPLSAELVNDKLVKHKMWRNGYAQLWDGWQLDVSNYNCSGYRFERESLVEMIGSFAMMRSCQFFNCDITYGKFNSAILEHATFSKCRLTKAYFPCSKLSGAFFHGCDMENVDFRMAYMQNVRIEGCTLRGSDFQDANLEGADFSLSDVSGCNFIGTALDFSKNNPSYCYCTDGIGKTIMLVVGHNAVYDVPLFMQQIDPMCLNAAYRMTEHTVNQMIDSFNHGWRNL